MTHYSSIAAVGVAALTFGIAEPQLPPIESAPLPPGAIVIAADESAPGAMAAEADTDSAKMGEAQATHTGDESDTGDTDTKKIDQPETDDTTGAVNEDQ